MTAIDTEPGHLKRAAERRHGGKATLAQSVSVYATFERKMVWEAQRMSSTSSGIRP
jgi:hypothetical protein